MIWVAILALGLGAGTLAGIVGFGASIMLMPALMLAFGPQEAVPIMAIAALLANFSRVVVWWREVDWRANAYYCATAIPAAALGARTLLVLDPRIVEGTLGAMFLVMIPARRWLLSRGLRINAWQLAMVGAGIGFLSGMVASTGPINTPFYLAYGLRRGAYIATEAVCAFSMHVTRGTVLARYRLLTGEVLAIGLVLGAVMFAGSWIGKRLLDRMSDRVFLAVIEALLVIMGLQFLVFPR